jgi:hypothetical protein
MKGAKPFFSFLDNDIHLSIFRLSGARIEGQNSHRKTGRNLNHLGIRIISLLIENYGHRTEVRKSLASNQDWIDQYFGKILPMMSGQTNVGLISMNRPGKPDLIHPEGQGTYRMSHRYWTNFST